MDGLAKELSEIEVRLDVAQNKLSAYEDLKTQIKLLQTQIKKSGEEGIFVLSCFALQCFMLI